MNRMMYVVSLVAVLLLACVSLAVALQITSVSRDAASGIVLEWQGSPGADFAVSRSDGSVDDWVGIADGLSSTSYTDATALVRWSFYRVEEEPSDLLRITGIASAENGVIVTWDGGTATNSTYTLSRSDLNLTNWLVLATGLETMAYTDQTASAEFAFYMVEGAEGPVGPAVYFFDDLETGGLPGWSNAVDVGIGGTTAWQLGTPANVGPDGAYSPDNVWATHINTNYDYLADVSLFTPVIDLTTATNATLSFAHWFEGDGIGDFYRVLAKDPTGVTNLTVVPIIPAGAASATTWTNRSVVLPSEVLGQEVRFEFRFDSDFFDEFAGWYIDDIAVKE